MDYLVVPYELMNAWIYPFFLTIRYLFFASPSVKVMFTRKRNQIFNISAWQNEIYVFGLPPILAAGDLSMGYLKKEVLKHAYGVCLEVGPGAGHTLKHYPKGNKVTKIYGVEPTVGLHDILRKEIVKQGLEDKYHIVSCGIQESEALALANIRAGSIDTIVLVQVMCSIPTPKLMIQSMIKLLKPGGQLLLFEHVQSDDPSTKFVQNMYMLYWPHLMGGCHMDRPTGKWLAEMGDWKEVDIYRPAGEKGVEPLGHAMGRLVKA